MDLIIRELRAAEPGTLTLIATSRGLGVKCINAGGASAFKDGMLKLSLDDEIPVYGLSTRKIMGALLDAVEEIGLNKTVVTENRQVTERVRRERVDIEGLDDNAQTGRDNGGLFGGRENDRI